MDTTIRQLTRSEDPLDQVRLRRVMQRAGTIFCKRRIGWNEVVRAFSSNAWIRMYPRSLWYRRHIAQSYKDFHKYKRYSSKYFHHLLISRSYNKRLYSFTWLGY